MREKLKFFTGVKLIFAKGFFGMPKRPTLQKINFTQRLYLYETGEAVLGLNYFVEEDHGALRRLDRSRMNRENDDWFPDLAVDRGERQIVPTEKI